MRKIHIINPAAGMSKAHLFIPKGIEVYETKDQHDLERYIREVCSEDPEVHFTVYGGDGTVSEAVNGIMSAGSEAAEKAVLSVVPKGSGNDFVRNFSKKEVFQGRVDVLKCNDRYGINSINIGFDCDVVVETDKVKKNLLTSGSLGYIYGVGKVFFREFGTPLDITLTDQNGEKKVFIGNYMMTSLGNGKYCGGGFKFAPAARLDDGLIDGMVVNKMSRSTFLKLVADYRAGKHVDEESGEVFGKYKGLLTYFKCTEMTVKNINRLGIDGEVIYTDHADISVIPSAINVRMPALDLTKLSNSRK